jgi:hypothetical protein
MKYATIKILKSMDQFGHPIMMNHDGETIYKTLPGGTVTLALNIFIVWYSVSQVILMFSRGNNSLGVNETIANFDKIGAVYL